MPERGFGRPERGSGMPERGGWTRSASGGRAAIGDSGCPSWRSAGDGSHQPDQSSPSSPSPGQSAAFTPGPFGTDRSPAGQSASSSVQFGTGPASPGPSSAGQFGTGPASPG